MNGTSYDGLEEFRKQHEMADVRKLVSLAAAAVDRVLAPKAEIHERWAENEEDYPAWRRSLEDLRSRLAAATNGAQ